LKGDSHSHFRFGRSNGIDAVNSWKLKKTENQFRTRRTIPKT
jgi:hypothetical protein